MEFRFLKLLMVTVVMLHTYIHCQVVPGSDSNINCNACCQGPAGINGVPGAAGIPGSNGNNGSPGRDGRDGLRGDSGSKGDKGEIGIGERGPKGAEGPSGVLGDRGLRGLPGKVGPSGPAGQIGPIGPIGPSGRVRESAFTVYKTSPQTASSDNEIISFDAAHINIGGHFDMNTNRFICQIPGTYFFSYSVHVIGGANPDILLVKDGETIANARAETVVKMQVGSSVVLEMEVGNQVWLKFANPGEGANNGRQSHFSGFLLYEH